MLSDAVGAVRAVRLLLLSDVGLLLSGAVGWSAVEVLSVRPCPAGRGRHQKGVDTFSRDDVVVDGRNHSGRTRRDECENTEATKHTRVREKARVRERVPDGLRPDG